MRFSAFSVTLFCSVVFVAPPSAGLAQNTDRVVIEVRQTATGEDDYLCWSPVLSSVRLIEPETAPVEVVLSSNGSTAAGAVEFAPYLGFIPTPGNLTPSSTLQLTLPSDGSPVQFMISGAVASTDGQDVRVVAQDPADNSELGDTPVMVRVRKNAETLTAIERERFLEALGTLHGHRRPVGPTERFEKYAVAHGRAFGFGIHGGPSGLPLFLAWHRAFLMSIERELQAIDARVALPYWRFDEDSRNIFQRNFLGTVEGTSTLVRFTNNNPLNGWRMSSGGPLVRARNPDTRLQDIYPSFQFDPMSNIVGLSGRDTYGGAVSGRGINGEIEARHHNYAHVAAGGWVTSGTSPRDPLFYLLHANVDRAWAEWQGQFDRFNPGAEESYSLQGAYPGGTDPMRQRQGTYAQDVMWPWSQESGATTPGDLLDDWPTSGFPFPEGFENEISPLIPTPAAMVDYLNVEGNSVPHNVCYDNLGYTE